MDKYRVIMADDEAHIREGISRKINWEALGFRLVGEAENGQEALELAEQLHPDVILTDIQMPFLTGLELCKRSAIILPATKFVVFSGFDEFDYAQQAVRLNVSEYILKPIDTAELVAVLEKLKQQLDAERAQRQNLETLQTLYQESLPVLRELFLTRLLDGQACDNRIAEEAKQHHIDLEKPIWQVALVHPEGVDNQRELTMLSIRKLLEEQLQLADCTVVDFFYSDVIALLVGCDTQEEPYRLMNQLNRVCRLSESYLEIPLTVGLGLPCGLDSLSQSTQSARTALEYRVLQGTGRTIYIADMEPQNYGQLLFDDQDERALSSAVKLGSEEDIRQAVERVTQKLQQMGPDLSQSQLFFLELVTCLLKLTRSGDLTVADVFGAEFTGSLQITDFASPEELGQWCLERCLRLRELIGGQRSDSAGRTVERAKDFIQEHFAQSELSVETLCDYLHLSPAYFSTLFKRETGMTFTAYVTQVRMEEAGRLLRQTEEKTYLIAQKIGYEDPNYFSYVFKKHFGLTPTKYRAGM